MRRIAFGLVLGATLFLGSPVLGVAHAAQGTACRTGDSSLFVGPGSGVGALGRRYDHNGDNYICVNSGTSGQPYYDNHFQ